MNSRALVVVAAIFLAGGAVADELKSGPPVGCTNDRSGFRPQFVTGPAAGKTYCPV
jgi:hypothetical protein